MSETPYAGRDLPLPSDEAAAVSAALAEQILGEIRASGGSIGFDRFMELALYAPVLGYYSGGAAKFGEEGDFVTAPEVSPLFAQCISQQVAELLSNCNGGDVLELGAGSGALAADLLEGLREQDALPGRYMILEVSADLRERQRAHLARRLPELIGRVEWLDRLPESAITGVVLANEVADALPCRRFRIERETPRVRELAVAEDDGRFMWCEREADEELVGWVNRIETTCGVALPAGYESECRPRMPAWVASMADTLKKGGMLLFDYGMPRREYYLAERRRGTLLCHYRHRAHDDPFFLPGLQDIAAWVDFTAIAEAGAENDLELAGYATQAHFLMACGLIDLLAVEPKDERERYARAREARILTLPGEMGERFRVMGLARGISSIWRGFGLRDLSGRL